MKAYKGFDKDLKCRNFQYEVGKTYEEKDAQICKTGFHACENPLEVFRYYPPCNGHRYCEVEQSGTLSKSGDSFKVASTKIKIGAELGLKGLIQASVSFILDKINQKNDVAANIDFRSVVIDTNVQTAAVNMGCQSGAISSGDQSAATNTGKLSMAKNTGRQSAAINVGDGSAAEVTNRGSVAIATGRYSKAKASLGSAIVLVERGDWNGHVYPLNNIKAAIVDGEKIKADTWYTLRNGEFVEV